MNPIEHDTVAYYQKRLMVLRTTLISLKWHRALRCLEYALRYHTGTRKDKKTPEFLHQVEQALFALTLRTLLLYPEETICVIILHDTLEDYYNKGVRLSNIREVATIPNYTFALNIEHDSHMADLVVTGVELLTNNVDGAEKPKNIYYPQMGFHVIAAVAKACDRMNNQSTMAFVFTDEKMRAKIDETMDYVFPMLKFARREFPQQEDAYQILKTVLEQQVRLLEHVIKIGK